MTGSGSWFEPATVERRDDGAPEVVDMPARLQLEAIKDGAPKALHPFLDEAIRRTLVPARQPWPKGVFVVLKERMQGQDFDALQREQFKLNRLQNLASVQAGQVDMEVDMLTYQADILTAAVNLEGFIEPLKDGKPVLNKGVGVWTIDGERVTAIPDDLRERVALVAKLPPVVYSWIAAEVNRLNDDPLGLRPTAKSLKTASA